MLGAQDGSQQKVLTLADPNGDARAVVSGASQAEAHLKQLNQPQHVQVDKAAVAEQPRFYKGPMDVDEATMKLAEQINQTYWDDPGTHVLALWSLLCPAVACFALLCHALHEI